MIRRLRAAIAARRERRYERMRAEFRRRTRQNEQKYRRDR